MAEGGRRVRRTRCREPGEEGRESDSGSREASRDSGFYPGLWLSFRRQVRRFPQQEGGVHDGDGPRGSQGGEDAPKSRKRASPAGPGLGAVVRSPAFAAGTTGSPGVAERGRQDVRSRRHRLPPSPLSDVLPGPARGLAPGGGPAPVTLPPSAGRTCLYLPGVGARRAPAPRTPGFPRAPHTPLPSSRLPGGPSWAERPKTEVLPRSTRFFYF